MDNEIKKVKNYEPQRQRMLELHRLKREAKEREINEKQTETDAKIDQKKEVERYDLKFYDNDKNDRDIAYDFECVCDCGNELVELDPVDDLTKQAIKEGFDLICDRCGNLYSDDEFFK